MDLPVWLAMSRYGVVSGSTTISAAARPKAALLMQRYEAVTVTFKMLGPLGRKARETCATAATG